MKLSIIILNYNVRFFLEQCILSVKTAIENLEAEVIVIDNASADDSCQMVKEKFPEITLIENQENVGFSKANNQAALLAKGEYLCILNPDTAVAEDTFLKALEFAARVEDMGALGVYLMDGTGNFLPESKRNLPTPKVSLMKLLGFDQDYYANDISQNENGEVGVLVGAFMLLKKTVYHEVGGFDEDYFMYGEDIDLSYKITLAGYSNYYFGETSILHYKGESTQKDEVYYERFYGAMKIFYNKRFQTNIFFDYFVSLGVWSAKKMSKISSGKNVKKHINYKHHYFLTEDAILIKNLSQVMKVDFENISKDNMKDRILENSLIVMDADYISYEEIFEFMTNFKNKGNSFRIRPKESNFILGSDQSDEKGSAIIF